ncbi:MAG TPA: cation-translocating P-type ATPase [Verrucomicrobiota bacterium]|nr:hypothetical protein [Verrucomicrobiales bacterium]HRI15362.1 cation-translocating P-type ATPase [Verrucomicrobiota bacterium]
MRPLPFNFPFPRALGFRYDHRVRRVAAEVAGSRSLVRCEYCGGPLPHGAEGERPMEPPARFCCYGCRVLGEARPRSLDSLGDAPTSTTPWFKIGVGVALASQAMLLGFAVNLTPPDGALRWVLHGALAASALTVLAVLGWPLLKASWDCVGRRRITVELLFLAGIVGAFGASVFSSITGVGAVYYEVVAVLLVVYTVGKTLTARARERAGLETTRLRDTFDTSRRIKSDGTEEICPSRAIEIGDDVRVLPGEPVPVDGRIQSGASFVRETPLTGEPNSVVRRAGDCVLAGSWVEDGELRLLATASGRNRRLDELLHWVERARSETNPSFGSREARFVDHVTAWFLPLVVAGALTTLAVWGSQGQWAAGLFNALAVLLVACPCALGLAAPLAWWNALATLAARGVVCRSTDVLDRLAQIRRVVFDKTGTLSESQQSLVDFAAAGGPSARAEVLGILGAVQSQSSHPVARAFAAAGIVPDPQVVVRSIKPVPARGLEAWVERAGREFRLQIGTRDWVLAGCPGATSVEPELLADLRVNSEDPHIYVAIEGRLVGLALVRERLRNHVSEAWKQLQELGCTVSVLTGDTEARTAQLLGVPPGESRQPAAIPAVEGSLGPIQKADRVMALVAGGQSVAFVGDGINDAPALRAATVGFALDSGAALATASADVVLCGGDLREVPRTLALARHVRTGVRSNLLFALAYNVLGIVLAATGKIGPISAALLMVGSSTIVSWRAVRIGAGGCASVRGVNDSSVGIAQWLGAAAILLQIPFLGYLGHLGFVSFMVVATVGVGLAALTLVSRRLVNPRRSTWAPALAMTLAMLGPGNLGMLLGWWVEAGFGPVMRNGVCLCCQSHHYFALTGKIPWMYLGMLAGGLPLMIVGWKQLPRRLGLLPLALLAAVGMVFGMAWGGDGMLGLLGPLHPHQFLGAFGGMTVGMLAGMIFTCGAGEALAAGWIHRRTRARP